MVSSSCSVVVSVAVVLQLLLLVSASTSYIDAICKVVTDKAFCLQTLNAYPPAVSAKDQYAAAKAVLSLGASQAQTCESFAEKAASRNPNLKQQFKTCQDSFKTTIRNFKGAAEELEEAPDAANYDVMLCYDETTKIHNLIGKSTDKDSQTMNTMTSMLDKYIALGVGATVSVGG